MIEVINAKGTPVRNLQEMLRVINFYEDILPEVIVDGLFDDKTGEAVVNFQKRYNLPATGVVDIVTFEKIVEIYNDALLKSGLPEDIQEELKEELTEELIEELAEKRQGE